MSSPSQHPDAKAKFVWPPGPASPPSIGEPQRAAVDDATSAMPAKSLWRTIEDVWLDVVTPPVRERLDAARFVPDRAWHYCPRCGMTMGPNEALLEDPRGRGERGCSACRSDSPIAEQMRLCRTGGWDRVVRLGEYTHPLRQMIHEVKFTAWRRVGTELGRVLGESIKTAMVDAREDGIILPEGRPMVVPVPASTWRRMSRGIDHAKVIARGVCETLDADLVPILARKHRPTQTSLTGSRRQANAAGSISLRRGSGMARWLPRAKGGGQSGGMVVVVDDIMTTGATLRAACRAVREGREAGGATTMPNQKEDLVIWGAVVARTMLRSRGGRGMSMVNGG